MRSVKKILLSMIVVGSLSYLTVGGAFALLNAETKNTSASISSGTLTFGNKVNAGSLCYTYNGTSNVNSACDALFSSGTQMYPGTPATAQVTITNNGSLNAADLLAYMPSCSMVTTPGATSPGGGDPCAAGGALFYIQETNSSFVATNCIYPAAAGACSFSADTLNYVATNYTSAASAIDLGSGPAAGASRYFVIGMELPSTASNTLQGEEAQFNLTWRITT